MCDIDCIVCLCVIYSILLYYYNIYNNGNIQLGANYSVVLPLLYYVLYNTLVSMRLRLQRGGKDRHVRTYSYLTMYSTTTYSTVSTYSNKAGDE